MQDKQFDLISLQVSQFASQPSYTHTLIYFMNPGLHTPHTELLVQSTQPYGQSIHFFSDSFM